MTCFNNIANCCPPPEPPEGCCISIEELETAFPDGVSLSIAGNTINFNMANWEINGCCAYNDAFIEAAPTRQCTSDWSYNAQEVTKCEETAAKKKVKYMSFPPGTVDLCAQGECPDIILASRTSNSMQEKAERVVVSELDYFSVTLVVGKFARVCDGGDPECVYVIGVSVQLILRAGGLTKVYRRYEGVLEYVDPDLVACCGNMSIPPVTVQSLKDAWYNLVVSGTDEFPFCNYLPEPPGIAQVGGLIEMSRVKVVTALTSPLTFSKDDPAPQFCNYPSFCLGNNNNALEKITVTFNRTQPPVYAARSYTRGPAGGPYCCFSRVINTFPTPDEAYDIAGPGLRNTLGTHNTVPPSPGTFHLVRPGSASECFNSVGLGSCLCALPPGTVFSGMAGCCEFPTFPAAQPDYLLDGYTKYVDSFSYNAVTGNDPIIHEYPVGSWTLTF